MLSGSSFETSGFAGSRSWAPIQVTPPRSMMVSSGMAQTINSSWPEYSPIRQIERPLVGRTEPPGDAKGRDNGRDHDDEHDGDRIDEERRVAVANRAFRIEHSPIAHLLGTWPRRVTPSAEAAAERYLRHHLRAPPRCLAQRTSSSPEVHAGSLSLSILRWHLLRAFVLSPRRVRPIGVCGRPFPPPSA